MLFELSYHIEGTTEKAYNIVHQLHNIKWDKFLKFVIFYN